MSFLRRLLLLSSRHLHHTISPSIPPPPFLSTVRFPTSSSSSSLDIFKSHLLPQTLGRSFFHATALSADHEKQRVVAIKKSPKNKNPNPKPKKSKKNPFMNQNMKFPKQRRGRMKGISCRGDSVSFGRYALRALEPGWITARAINAGRGAMARYARPGGKLWVRVIPDKSVTARPPDMRMGRGKGAIKCLVSVVKPGRILYEIDGLSEMAAREAIAIAARKIPIRTQFVVSC